MGVVGEVARSTKILFENAAVAVRRDITVVVSLASQLRVLSP
ncbi:MAG: hypothetical protein ACI9HK_004523 [Pirellulaceae bacterium]|jgi:hypothetical protein